MKEAMKVKAFQCSILKQFYIFLSEIVQLPVLQFTFNRLDTGCLDVHFTENPHQCSSSHDAYNPIPHLR